jgi:excisionase family DNA binding protein
MRLPDPREQPFMNPEEARALVPISRGSFYAGLRSGEIPSRRVGARYLIPTAEFATWAGLSTGAAIADEGARGA